MTWKHIDQHYVYAKRHSERHIALDQFPKTLVETMNYGHQYASDGPYVKINSNL